MTSPLKVLVTDACSELGYNLIFAIANGEMLKSRRVILHIFDRKADMDRILRICNELRDCECPMLAGVLPSNQYSDAFYDIDCAFLVSTAMLDKGENREDYIIRSALGFRDYGLALGRYAKKSVKVLVVGPNSSTNAFAAYKYASSALSPDNFSALTLSYQYMAQNQLSNKLNVRPIRLKDVFIWGSSDESKICDLTHAYYTDGGKKTDVLDKVDDEWARETFYSLTEGRKWEILYRKQVFSFSSVVAAAAHHMRAWLTGTAEGEVLSMCVCTPLTRPYGVEPGIFYSFPCTVDSNGNVKIKDDYEVNDWLGENMKLVSSSLAQEKSVVENALLRAHVSM